MFWPHALGGIYYTSNVLNWISMAKQNPVPELLTILTIILPMFIATHTLVVRSKCVKGPTSGIYESIVRVHAEVLKHSHVWGLKTLKSAKPQTRVVKTCNGSEVSELGRARCGPWSYPNLYPLPIRTYEKRGESPKHLREKSHYIIFLPRVLSS